MTYVYNTTDQKKINKKRKKEKKKQTKNKLGKKKCRKAKNPANRLCIDIFAFIHYVYCCYYLAKLFYSLSGGWYGCMVMWGKVTTALFLTR